MLGTLRAWRAPRDVLRATAGSRRALSAILDKNTMTTYTTENEVLNDECAHVDASVVGPYRGRPALRVPSDIRGVGIAHDSLYNKGTAFDMGERDRLGLRGMLPPASLSMEQQLMKVVASMRALDTDLAKHTFLMELHDRNETLFHRVLVRHIAEIAPLIYTPTVGQACLEFSKMYRHPRGMYFSSKDVGHMKAMVRNWPNKDVRVIVVTDGSRILGLGDLGANGMGIPIGKLALYCAAGGIAPHRVMPVVLDVGTNNPAILEDPFYLGLRQPRLSGKAYYEVVDEFLLAVYERWPKVLVQFEDFSSEVAQPILDRYRQHRLCFNDDVQGTGATVLAGALACLRQQGKATSELPNQRVVIVGSGSAGIGVATALRDGMTIEAGNMTPEEAASKFYVFDAAGLVAKGADWESFTPQQQNFGQSFECAELDAQRGAKLLDVIRTVKPTMLIGVSTVPGLFTEEVIRLMAEINEQPIIMPLSNPTAKAECTAEDAFKWSDGKCIFASGSPFEPVQYAGKTLTPSQCNNMFIFPGLGLGASLGECSVVSDGMMHAAAVACAEAVDEEEIARGQVFPSVARIRSVSKNVAIGVIKAALKEGLVKRKQLLEPGVDLDAFVTRKMYFPAYVPLYQNIFEN